MTELADLTVASLGEPRYDSPLADYVAGRDTDEQHVDETIVSFSTTPLHS